MYKPNNFHVQKERLNYLYDNLSGGLVGISLIIFVIFFAYQSVLDSLTLNLWLILNLSVVALRVWSIIKFKKVKLSQENITYYEYIFIGLALLSATMFGVSIFFIFPDDIQNQMILVLMMFALVAGATISFASYVKLFYVYIAIIILPLSYKFYFGHNDISMVFSISMLFYILSIVILASKVSPMVLHNIELASENIALVDSLEKEVKLANAANHAKSEFLSVMSHEIRTPLNAIMGFVQLLLYQEKDEKKKKHLDTINKSSKVLANIIDDVLDLSKIEAGKFELSAEGFNPHEEFNAVYALYEHIANEKNILLQKEIDPKIPEWLYFDYLRLKQIVSNLLSNALKFTPQNKKVLFRISYVREKSLLCFSIEDEGIGMKEEIIERIVKPFEQADSSTVRKYGGTGLGLSIVTKLLALMDSKLSIESKVDKGSNFSFCVKVMQHSGDDSLRI